MCRGEGSCDLCSASESDLGELSRYDLRGEPDILAKDQEKIGAGRGDKGRGEGTSWVGGGE